MANKIKKLTFKTIKSIIVATAIIIPSIIIFMIIINVIPPKKNVEKNPFVIGEGELPMIAAHRGGALENPENTMLAFREAVHTFEVDILETDVYITKDGHLVCTHDPYIDETCNANGDIPLQEVYKLCNEHEKKELNRHYIIDMTLEELEQYNFGYYFCDKSGNRPYKDVEDIEAAGLQIITLDKLFEEFRESHPDLLFSVEIKNGGEQGKKACDALGKVFEAYPDYKDRVLIASFHDSVENELRKNHPDLFRVAATTSAKNFVLSQYRCINIFDNSDFACLQIPMRYNVGNTIELNKKSLINRAHRRNVSVQYWTINDADEMRELIELGCDCIMTDNIALLKQVLAEYE